MWIVSFATPDLLYLRTVKNLTQDCIDLELPRHIQILDLASQDRAGYYGAVLHKPTYIREVLLGLSGHIVLQEEPIPIIMWVDADCRILEKIDIPSGEWDIGVIPHPMERNRIHFTPWIVSYLVFRPTLPTMQLLNLWAHLCNWPEYKAITERQETDHERFHWALSILGNAVRVKNILPHVRNKIHMDPRHRKRNKFGYDAVPKELDDWYPEEIKLPQDKHTAIMEHFEKMEDL